MAKTKTAKRSPARRKARPPAGAAPSAGWWGDGPSPTERWPGVTIEIPAVWHEGRQRWESPDARFYFDAAAAQRAVDFFPEFLRHHIGEFAGQPFTLLDYQQLTLTKPIFGWKRSSDGLRRFRKVFAFLPKGAGKSPWGAGTGLYLTIADNEPAAEVYALATDRDQARVVHSNAKVMVESSPDLLGICEILKDAIYHAGSRSTFKVLSSEASTKHGFRPHAAIYDEFHAQPDRDLFEALERSMVKRRQPLSVIITHSGHDDEGICFEEYELAKKVLSGTVDDPTLLPVIFEVTDKKLWQDPETWRRVNPGHGITIKHDAIAAAAAAAAAEPRKLNDFLRFHLNVWTNQATAWIPVEQWDACAGTLGKDEVLRTLPLAAGLDLAQKYDLAAFVMAFVEPIDGEAKTIQVIAPPEDADPATVQPREISLNFALHLVPHFWLPEETLKERVKKDRVPYDQWQKAGLLTVTEGNVIDYDVILRDILKLAERFPRLKESQIGYDPAFATDLALKLQARGYQVVEVLQNYKHMSEPAMVMEALIRDKRIKHDGHRVLRWNWENVAIKTDDAGRIRPVKPKKAAKKIDGVVASLMATSRAVLTAAAPAPGTVSVFADAPETEEHDADRSFDDNFEDEPWD